MQDALHPLRLLLLAACASLSLLLGSLRAQDTPPPPTDSGDGSATAESAPQGDQDSPKPPEGVSQQTLEDLVARIEDPDKRAALVEQLKALLAASGAAGQAEEGAAERSVESVSSFVRQLTTEIADTASRIGGQLAQLPDALQDLWTRLQDPTQRNELLVQSGLVLGVLVGGWLVSFLLRLILRRPRKALGERSDDQPNYTIPRRLGRAALRLFVDLVPPAGAAATVFGLSTALPFTHEGGVVALAAVGAYALERSIRALLLVVLSPNSPEIRLVPLDSEHAARMLRTLDRTAILAVWGYFALDVVRSLGASRELSDPLRDLYALLLFVAAVVTILRVRGRLVRAEPEALGQEAPPPEQVVDHTAAAEVGEKADSDAAAHGATRLHQRVLGVVGRLWWILALVYVAGLYLLWLSGIENGFVTAMRATGITALWICGALVVLSLVNSLLKRLHDQLIDWTGSLPNFDRNVPRYIGLLRAASYAVVWITVLGFAFDAWGLGTLDLLNSEGVRNLIAMALGVFLIVLLALAVIDASTALATTYLKRRQRESKDSAKIRTLVPLANKAIRVVVTVLAILMVMSQLGVSIGPILASVSFVGLAIGFGAQSLVKDIITGTFNLLEDNVSVGDIVSVSGTGGVVETINIRTIQLRDLSGNLHTFPWGQIETITNFTREYGRYLIECGVAYREDCDEVMDVLREIGAGMQKDRAWRHQILEPIEILGVDRFEDSAVIIRARLKTMPAAQWSVGREFNRRMKKVFDERGIEIPFPHQTIYMGEDKQGQAPPLRLARTPKVAKG